MDPLAQPRLVDLHAHPHDEPADGGQDLRQTADVSTMDTDPSAQRSDRSVSAPAVRVHADRVAPSQRLDLTPSMAFAMIARDADAAAGMAGRAAGGATTPTTPAPAEDRAQVATAAVEPALLTAPRDAAAEHDDRGDEDVAAASGATPPRRTRWWRRLLRRRARSGCSMCGSTTLPCPLGHR